uniref:Small ribosomal subunit protein mS29 n=1 Tax=Arion vulgaris TaxID=1028688 RepID=A0A0B6Z623_9EUPU
MEATMFRRVCSPAFYSRSHSVLRCFLNEKFTLNKACVFHPSLRASSSATQSQPADVRQVFRTSVDDPRQHTLDHEGLYYRISEVEANSLFNECIQPHQLRLMKTFNETCVMVRKPSLELEDYIRNINFKHPVHRFVLYGLQGAGKSAVMNHTMHACYRDNWIIVHVPWAGRWVRGWHKEVTESTYKAGRYDLPTDGAAWLNHFQIQNQGRLKDLKTTSEYTWTKREKADIGTPLEEIINFGLTRVKFSTDCIGVILKELRHQAQNNGLKIFVGINAVNAFYVEWDNRSALLTPEKRKLHPSEFSVIHNFKKMLSPTWTNGVVVCTVDQETNTELVAKNYTPFYLLGQQGFAALDPFVPILVPEYSEKEALSTINYFIDRNWIQNEFGKTEEGKKEIMFVSNKNAFSLTKLCCGL